MTARVERRIGLLVVCLLGFLMFAFGPLSAQGTVLGADSCLLLIDIQDFYFPGSPSALVEPEAAAREAARLLAAFRSAKYPLVHIYHQARSLADIRKAVQPLPGEMVIGKKYANAFRDTNLLEYLRAQGVKKLVIAGMMTHMCVEAAARAAVDYGFEVTVVDDACATRDLEYAGKTIRAADVHAATLASIAHAYGKVKRCDEVMKELGKPADFP